IQAGFETEAGAQLARAAGDVCRETISQLGGIGECVDGTMDTFSDRIEIAIHCRSQLLPPLGLEAFALSSASSGGAGGFNRAKFVSGVERALFQDDTGVGPA